MAARKAGLGRLDLPAYSLRALQEGVVNALGHRDYTLPSQVRVFVFDKRIEIATLLSRWGELPRAPGTLPLRWRRFFHQTLPRGDR